jgi:UPF0755 protein
MSDPDQLGIGLCYDPEPPVRRRRRTLGRVVLLVSVLVVLLAVPIALVLGGSGLLHRLNPTPVADYTGQGSGSVVVQVKPGDSLTRVGQRLEAAGVVKSVAAFTDAASADDRATTLQPGYYRLHKRMSGAAALDLLLSPTSRVSTRVTVPEGATLAQVVRLFATRTRLRAAALEAAAKAPKATPLPGYANGHPEGFLFPATYDVDPGTTADAVMSGMVAQFVANAGKVGLVSGAGRLGLTPYQVVTVASILEKEARLPGDFPKVARVVYNRLRIGMKLQLDSTLNYVLPHRKGHLSNADTHNPSPYNTYEHLGLPPTPIDNPGAAALSAALHPATGGWLYFVTVDKAGHTGFATTYQQFNALKQEARRNGVIP